MAYYTYEYKHKDIQLDINSVLDSLFEGGTDALPIRETNIVYQDISYPRYRTIQYTAVLPTQKVRTDVYVANINRIGVGLQDWLTNNQASIKYKVFQIPKATGGYRTIKAPEDNLMNMMRYLKIQLEHIGIRQHDSAYAYVPQRDCKKAIMRHQSNGSNWFLKLDISKFFDHCTPEFIKLQLKEIYPFSEMKVQQYDPFINALTGLACYEGSLPQGTPLSPLITNWLMIPIDYMINKVLHEQFGEFFVYTRYADDMLISCRTQFDYNKVVEAIQKILKGFNCPFELNTDKTRYGSKNGRNWNLGIMYNKDNNLTVGYKRKHQLKVMLHQLAIMVHDSPQVTEEVLGFMRTLMGEIAYLNNIEPDYCSKLLAFMNNKRHYDAVNIIKHVLKYHSFPVTPGIQSTQGWADRLEQRVIEQQQQLDALRYQYQAVSAEQIAAFEAQAIRHIDPVAERYEEIRQRELRIQEVYTQLHDDDYPFV